MFDTRQLQLHLAALRHQFQTLHSLIENTYFSAQGEDIELKSDLQVILFRINELLKEMDDFPYGFAFQKTTEIILKRLNRLTIEYFEEWQSETKHQIKTLCEGAVSSLTTK